jgi:hypothetical protein
MEGFTEQFATTQRKSIEFLLLELDTALTFLDVAGVTSSEVTANRACQNARKGYDTVVAFLPRLNPTAQERAAIQSKLALLKRRLEAAGQRF